MLVVTVITLTMGFGYACDARVYGVHLLVVPINRFTVTGPAAHAVATAVLLWLGRTLVELSANLGHEAITTRLVGAFPTNRLLLCCCGTSLAARFGAILL